MTSSGRSPRDDEEELKAHIAILRGQSKSLKEVLTDMLEEEPSDDLVEAVENRILLAQEQEESIDLEKMLNPFRRCNLAGFRRSCRSLFDLQLMR